MAKPRSRRLSDQLADARMRLAQHDIQRRCSGKILLLLHYGLHVFPENTKGPGADVRAHHTADRRNVNSRRFHLALQKRGKPVRRLRVGRIADADALFLRGRAYFLQKNYEQAKVDFDAAVETKESYQLCFDIYELYQESSMKADGDRYLEAAVKIEPKTTEDYYNIGCAYYYLEEQDEAVKAFSKAMKDGSSAAMEMLGEVYLSNGQNDEAKALFSSYLSTDGFAAAANNGLALCALAENDTDSALSYIEEGLKTAEDSDRENLLFNQIVSYEKRADFDTAKSLMADFLAAYPENTAAQRENTFLQNR